MTEEGPDCPVEIVSDGTAFTCKAGEHLLGAMIRAGRTGIKVGCRNGGCGICRIRIHSGDYSSGKMTRSRISEEDERAGVVLACRIYPQAALQVEALPLPS
ncbi:2Fe-2S iron-sulfur cluster-binding protein [Novosphingobium mangrovi (ex Huang et al. 2023)]|uniref:2Fe-2S iron-sulfur cluster-binding protein n=1 Tax=Novosphingobium mangrovi (ex Huang et al. 2023) TaxID=2976432 RepID=A0ABT2I986_9SPHN|nr:2Fe-2S iron-sulfur cluster-binding protein [Novosphingobium mangrovi (ex Huang et al. 2023)]MCT2401381.1 2Fe-2S iron-sulfur cluster-binding protein [Novosphingobium mangrovi (ex Huang et al. 2023)]